MGNTLLIISFLIWWSHQPPDDFDAQLTRFVCNHHQAECGMFENPLDPNNPWGLIECGVCDGHQMCGGMVPNYDGSNRDGMYGQCGGGCTEVNSFSCFKYKAAVLCTVPHLEPMAGCIGQTDHFSWCCPLYTKLTPFSK